MGGASDRIDLDQLLNDNPYWSNKNTLTFSDFIKMKNSAASYKPRPFKSLLKRKTTYVYEMNNSNFTNNNSRPCRESMLGRHQVVNRLKKNFYNNITQGYLCEKKNSMRLDLNRVEMELVRREMNLLEDIESFRSLLLHVGSSDSNNERESVKLLSLKSHIDADQTRLRIKVCLLQQEVGEMTEQLDQLISYRNFLFRAAPKDWQAEINAKREQKNNDNDIDRSHEEDIMELYWTDAKEFLDNLTNLENQNIRLMDHMSVNDGVKEIAIQEKKCEDLTKQCKQLKKYQKQLENELLAKQNRIVELTEKLNEEKEHGAVSILNRLQTEISELYDQFDIDLCKDDDEKVYDLLTMLTAIESHFQTKLHALEHFTASERDQVRLSITKLTRQRQKNTIQNDIWLHNIKMKNNRMKIRRQNCLDTSKPTRNRSRPFNKKKNKSSFIQMQLICENEYFFKSS